MLTWLQLLDLKLSELAHAGDGWGAVSKRADASRELVDVEMVGALAKTQKSDSAVSATQRLERLGRNYQYLHTECGLIRSTLNSLASELATPQRRVMEAVREAETLGYRLSDAGTVEFPAALDTVTGQEVAGGTATGSPGIDVLGMHIPLPRYGGASDEAGVNPHRARAQELADRIAYAVAEAREIDDRFDQAMGKLKAPPGLTVDDATWTDAAKDASAVRDLAGNYLRSQIPTDKDPAERKQWWLSLPQEKREEYLTVYPDVIGNLDGIPATVRDEANRENLQLLIGKLAGQHDERSQSQLDGLLEIDRKLRDEGKKPPMFLLGVGDEGNGRAIVSYGNPDTSQNVSAYVPGLETGLDKDFARNDLKRARDTALDAASEDRSSTTASIVWLGYDAPQLTGTDDIGANFDVAQTADAEAGAPAYDSFMKGLTVTNENSDPHLTAIGHSYGSRLVGAAAVEPGGIAGVDDIILVGSPGVGVNKAADLGVSGDHVFVGAAAHDPVTWAPSGKQVIGGVLGSVLGGPGGAVIGGGLADPHGNWFGKDPASEAFGATRFAVDDGPLPFSDGTPTPAHSNYFDPERDPVSATNIARIVSGHSDKITTEHHR
ncbi:alpha/beta hydrolase [Streptomyces xanthochromogenes]|uniref:alpha/beta hydrolase n=1 Tax=Streptomyces xanthochromogenes TaxID=67384 RepID=UPI00342E32CE